MSNQTLLITGGTGSFGTSVLKRLLHSPQFSEIRIFSRDEKKQHDLRLAVNHSKVKFFVGDVRDRDSLEVAVAGSDYIFHAAALKQVPSCEFFPMEAVRTNILGTDNLLWAATKHQVRRVVVLSTDKAAYPINAMGITKAMMEKVMVARSRSLRGETTILSGTRYGNVMASRGSVIPHFISQIKAGIPLTITNPEMTRFMMTLDDAVNLVLYAFEKAQQGDLFVQKAPAATVHTLAVALLDIYGASNELRIIGIRHGEKLYETLVGREDMAKAVDLGGYFRIPADSRDLNYDHYYEAGMPANESAEEYHSHMTDRLDVEQMKTLLLSLPEVRHDLFPSER